MARPTEVADFENPHDHGTLMEFRADEVVLPRAPGEATLGVGLLPDGPPADASSRYWDTDTVSVAIAEPPRALWARRLSASRGGGLAVEVSHPSPFDPSAVRLGPRFAFEPVADERVQVPDRFVDDLQGPVRSAAVAGHENHWLLDVRAGGADGSGPEAWSGDLAVGLFPDGEEAAIPAGNWAVARVADAPDLDATG